MKKLICVVILLWAGIVFGADSGGPAQAAPGPGPGPGPELGPGKGGISGGPRMNPVIENIFCPPLVMIDDSYVTVTMSGKKYVVKLRSTQNCWWDVIDKDGKIFWLNILNADTIYKDEE